MMKKLMKAIVMIAAVLVITAGYSGSVHAQVEGEIKVSKLMTAMQDIDAKAEPDSNADTIFSYEAGAYVLVAGETQNGWYVVYYQGKTGYIDKNTPVDPSTSLDPDKSQVVLEVQDIDMEALDAELEEMQTESKIIVEEVEQYRAELRRSRIWGTIIVLLVIGIFAVGIVSTVRAEKKKKEGQDISEDQKEDQDISEDQQENSNGEEQPQENNNKKRAHNGGIIDLDKE